MFIPNFIRRSGLFKAIQRKRHNRALANNLIREGMSRFAEEQPDNGSLKDFVSAAKKHYVSYDEYFFHYEFWRMEESERGEFMSQASLMQFYRTYLTPEVFNIFWNKVKTLRIFSDIIKRRWLHMQETTYEEFCLLLSSCDLIVKPVEASCGKGIFKLKRETDETKVKTIYQELTSDNYVVEECISNYESIKQFHPSSLNTVRIVTVLNSKDEVNVLGSFIRFGTGGNVVDNGGSDGILAMIDIDSGKIFTDAYNKKGIAFKVHPDTGIKFSGFTIPRFQEMIEVCKLGAKRVPQARILGWDIVLRDDNEIDVVEANAMPDAYGLQMPVKKGYRSTLMEMMR